MSTKVWLVILFICTVSGFYIGRNTTNPIVSIEYIKGDTMYIEKRDLNFDLIRVSLIDSVRFALKDNAEKIILPQIERESVNIDSLTNIIYSSVEDSIRKAYRTVIDWNIKREYEGLVYDIDTLGSANYEAIVQYNKLQGISFNVAPVIRRETAEINHTYTPFVRWAASTLGTISAGGGIIRNNIGFDLSYIYNTENRRKGLEAGFIVRF